MCAVVVSETSPLELCRRRTTRRPVPQGSLFHCTTNSGHFYTKLQMAWPISIMTWPPSACSLWKQRWPLCKKQRSFFIFGLSPPSRFCLAHPTANTSPRNPATAGTSVHPRQSLGEEGNYRHSPSYILHYGVANRSSLTLVSVPSPDDSSRPALVTTVCSDLGVLDLLLPV